MSGFTYDSNIVIDALAGLEAALREISSAREAAGRVCLSRMVWIEVMSKGTPEMLDKARLFLDGFVVDEVDAQIAERAALLRRQRSKLKSPDALILACAQVRGQILVTRNIKDFPIGMPGIRVPYLL